MVGQLQLLKLAATCRSDQSSGWSARQRTHRALPARRATTNSVPCAQANHEKMKAKVEKKMKSEREYYTQRYGFQAS